MIMVGTVGHASGTLIGNGKILTAAHVYEGTQELTAVFTNGDVLPVERLWKSDLADFALLGVKYPRGYHGADIDCDPVRTGDEVWIVGNPRAGYLTVRWAVTYGHVAALELTYPEKYADKVEQGMDQLIPLDAHAFKGNSGGPVFNQAGDVVGILTAGLVVPSFFDAIPIGISIMTPATEFCGAGIG